ncbi:MAG: thioredoxin domain-containing protein [Melioribacteraceae bacterium]|nr:thioredoxin domain-containing protein [Melioribacteraceae bacterium]
MKPNQLINEISPYLLQHAYNPVNWYAWKEEAFEKATKENKPIFLSIGYSTCHWCHVMEKESFEDFEVAKILNENFISIKVDREERPDIDSIYMTTCQLMTGRGGWPLSIFMMPNKKPFFAGTYFPKENRYGKIGFKELLLQISNAWKTKYDQINYSSDEITSLLQNYFSKINKNDIPENIIDIAFDSLNSNYDKEFAGFGKAPKFPSPHNLLFLLRYFKIKNDSSALNIVLETLKNMRLGGIYDQIGFGFHRYSTDRKWLVPHFEKMLYDQAMLIIVYSEAFQITKNAFYKNVVYEIIEYLNYNMRSKDNAYFSAEDADSEGEEGKYYLWTYDEIKNLLNEFEFNLAVKIFNVDKDGNYLDEITHTKNGKNILHLKYTLEELAQQLEIPYNQFINIYNEIINKLKTSRQNRIHPFKDDKILTDWNSLLISAFSIAGRIFGDNDLINYAENIFQFINKNLLNKNYELLHCYRNNKSQINATLDDYSFLIWGLIELHQSTFNKIYLEHAINLANVTIENYYDESNGGFFIAGKSSNDLIIKTKDHFDAAIPSGNSVMIYNLVRLNSILFINNYKKIIDKTFEFYSHHLTTTPSALTFLLVSFMQYNYSNELVIVYDNNKDLNDAINKISNSFIPFLNVIPLSINNKPAEFESYNLLNEKITFYLCKNFNCQLPTNDLNDVLNEFM